MRQHPYPVSASIPNPEDPVLGLGPGPGLLDLCPGLSLRSGPQRPLDEDRDQDQENCTRARGTKVLYPPTIWWFTSVFLVCLVLPLSRGAEEKPILEILPTLAQLGEGWTTNLVTYLIDPRSHPPEIDYQNDPRFSEPLRVQREAMRTNGRTGCGMILYGRGNLVMDSGLYRVCIQRWAARRPLHNAWAGWKMNPARVVRDDPPVGEDCFWLNEWWRDTLVRRTLVFRRGLFHVVVEAGPLSDPGGITRLARLIDGNIRGRAAAGSLHRSEEKVP